MVLSISKNGDIPADKQLRFDELNSNKTHLLIAGGSYDKLVLEVTEEFKPSHARKFQSVFKDIEVTSVEADSEKTLLDLFPDKASLLLPLILCGVKGGELLNALH